MLNRISTVGFGLIVASALAIGSSAAFPAAGRTAGNATVSSAGQAQYSVPIVTPPGTNGMQPSLALTYSHSNGDSKFGLGWSLSGLSGITRCSSTWVQDGTPRNVRNDSADKFCMDGSRLRLTGGVYGQAGSTYQTEIESFARVTAYGTAGNGPSYFIAETKDGQIVEYGNSADSRIESVAQSTVRFWAVNKRRDRSGNSVLFNYAEDSTNGSFLLANIQYTANSTLGVSPPYTVTLSYASIPSGEVDVTYLAGAIIKRLSRATQIDVNYGSTLVRRYILGYEGSLSSTLKSRLTSIQECAGSAPDCYPATTFTYQDGSPGLAAEVATSASIVAGTKPLPMDVNGDGREDLVYSSSATSGAGTWMVMFANASGSYNTPINTGISNSNFNGAIVIDYNADGLDDLLAQFSGTTWWVMVGTTSGLASPANTGAPVTVTGKGTNAHAIDVEPCRLLRRLFCVSHAATA